MKREPILIPCEGSGAESWYCPMCAIPGHKIGGGMRIPQHNRRDILAELARGDFDRVVDQARRLGLEVGS